MGIFLVTVKKKIWTFNFMVKALQFSGSSNSNNASWITAFHKGLIRICSPSKMARLTPKFSIQKYN